MGSFKQQQTWVFRTNSNPGFLGPTLIPAGQNQLRTWFLRTDSLPPGFLEQTPNLGSQKQLQTWGLGTNSKPGFLEPTPNLSSQKQLQNWGLGTNSKPGFFETVPNLGLQTQLHPQHFYICSSLDLSVFFIYSLSCVVFLLNDVPDFST